MCSAVNFDGEGCARPTNDSSGLCGIHRAQMKVMMEADVLHCRDCPLPIRDKEGKVLADETKETACSQYMSNAQGLCFFELSDMFKVLEGTEDFHAEFEFVLNKERTIVKRQWLFNTKSATVQPDMPKNMGQYYDHLEKYMKVRGLHPDSRNADKIPVKTTAQAAKFLDMLAGEKDGTPDVDMKKYHDEAGMRPGVKRVVEEKHQPPGVIPPKPKLKALEELEEDGGN